MGVRYIPRLQSFCFMPCARVFRKLNRNRVSAVQRHVTPIVCTHQHVLLLLIALFLCVLNTAESPTSRGLAHASSRHMGIAFWSMIDLIAPRNHDPFPVSVAVNAKQSQSGTRRNNTGASTLSVLDGVGHQVMVRHPVQSTACCFAVFSCYVVHRVHSSHL